MITNAGQTVRCEVQNIRETSRGSKGVKLVNLSVKDRLVGVSEVVKLDEDDLEHENSLGFEENTTVEAVKDSQNLNEESDEG